MTAPQRDSLPARICGENFERSFNSCGLGCCPAGARLTPDFALSPSLSYRRRVPRGRRVGAVKRVWTACTTDTTDCRKTLIETHETTILGATHAAPRIVGTPRINDCGACPVGSRAKCHHEYNREAYTTQHGHGHSPRCFLAPNRQLGKRSRGGIIY